MRSRLTLFLLLILSVSACRKSDDAEPQRPDIYAVGVKDGIATCWKNDSAVALDAGSWRSDAYGIALSGTDIYVAGVQYVMGGKSVAMLWKNGIPTALSDGTREASATGVAILGSDVYVVGYEHSANEVAVATYWKNGVPVRLGPGDKMSSGTDIALHGGEVYIVGTRLLSRGYVNCCCKAGVPINLGDTTASAGSQPAAISISDGNIYAVWTEYDAQFRDRTFYSKNFGAATRMGDGSDEAGGSDIAVQGSDVYIAGWGRTATASRSTVAKYWKNGTPTLLTDGSLDASASSIAVDGSDIYVGGSCRTAAVSSSPVYWKNGTVHNLADSATFGFVRQILLKRG